MWLFNFAATKLVLSALESLNLGFVCKIVGFVVWYIIHCNNQFCVKNALNNWANRKKSHLPLDMTHTDCIFFER